MSSWIVPDEELEKMRCSFCKEYLSCFPVYSYSNNEEITCGRCPILNDKNPVKFKIYEMLAKHILFPCRYQQYGCEEKVSGKKMANHEESCAFRQYFCPSTPLGSCPWQGSSNELYPHYENMHKAFILTSFNLEIDLFKEYEDNYLLLQDQHLFIVHIKGEPSDSALWCSVQYIGQESKADKFYYKITLTIPKKTNTVKFDKKEVGIIKSMCLNKSEATYIDCNEVINSLHGPFAICCSVHISSTAEEADNAIQIDSTDVTLRRRSIDEARLREIECPVCNEHMVPPIFQCVAGHSICTACKPKVKKCPTCRNPIEKTRNFTLEKMSDLINYYCKNFEEGCSFISGSNHIREHEGSCEYGAQKCLVANFTACRWSGRKNDIVNHFRNKHLNLIMDVKELCWVHKSQKENELFIILFDENIFRFIFKFQYDTLYWTVQACGAATAAEQYGFELDFIDSNTKDTKLYLKHNCVKFTDNDIFGTKNSTVKMSLNSLGHMMQRNQLSYKFQIIKK